MGARAHMSPRLLQILPADIEFGYIGRPERASPGEGYPAAHTVEQTRIIRTALDLSVPVSVNPVKAARRALAHLTGRLQPRNSVARARVAAVMKSFRFSGRAAVVCSLILAIGIPSVADGLRRGPQPAARQAQPLEQREPRARARRPRSSPTTSTYGTRQSNKKDGDGGGAIYGCRSNPATSRASARATSRAAAPSSSRPSARETGRIEVGNTDRRAVHDQRHRRRHRPERRQGRRQGGGRLRRRRRRHRAVREPPGRAGRRDRHARRERPRRRRRPSVDRQRLHGQVQPATSRKCSYTASPVGSPAAAAAGGRGHAEHARQRERGRCTAPGSFHLQVIC